MARRGDVDLDRHRDVARHRLDGEVEEQLLEQTAVLHAGGLADEVDRDLGAHGDVAADADEVDVHELAPGGVALDLPGEREHVVAVDLEGDQRVGAALAGEDVLQLAGRDGDRDGVGAEAVDDGGDLALTAQAAGGRRAQLGARLGGESDVRHGDAKAFEPGFQRRTAPEHAPGRSDAGRRDRRSLDVVAAEDLADAGVLEDGVERLGDDRGDREHREAVEVLVVGDRQRVGDDHLAHGRVLQPVDGRARQQRRGWRRSDTRVRTPLHEQLGGADDGAGGVDHVVDEHADAAVDLADDLGRPRRRCACPSGRRLSMNARSASMSCSPRQFAKRRASLPPPASGDDDRDARPRPARRR